MAVIIIVEYVHVKQPQGGRFNCGCKFFFFFVECKKSFLPATHYFATLYLNHVYREQRNKMKKKRMKERKFLQNESEKNITETRASVTTVYYNMWGKEKKQQHKLCPSL